MTKDYTNVLAQLLAVVEKEGASDLHITAGRHPVIRISGELIMLADQPQLSGADARGILQALVDEKKYATFLETQELDFSYHNAENLRLRGNAYIQRGEVGIALRVIDHVRTIEELGLPKVIEQFATKKQGFFLVVGPVGQGKSTTLAAIIQMINTTRKEHIVTIENPIEYVYEEQNSIIDQREVGIDTADFQTGLFSAFRQDVNVIMIGEMRNIETMAAAVTAAETGHLVLSTLHTNNAPQTIDRIIDSFPANQQDQIRTQLAGSLLGIFSQRLIPRISGGLVPAYEVLIKTHAVANLIREKRTHELDAVIETGFEHGMVSMNRSLAELVRSGEVTADNARRHSFNPKGLEKLL